jgi:hypothetical protein
MEKERTPADFAASFFFFGVPDFFLEIPEGVARDGIEPPTRGFSVRCSTN